MNFYKEHKVTTISNHSYQKLTSILHHVDGSGVVVVRFQQIMLQGIVIILGTSGVPM